MGPRSGSLNSTSGGLLRHAACLPWGVGVRAIPSVLRSPLLLLLLRGRCSRILLLQLRKVLRLLSERLRIGARRWGGNPALRARCHRLRLRLGLRLRLPLLTLRCGLLLLLSRLL